MKLRRPVNSDVGLLRGLYARVELVVLSAIVGNDEITEKGIESALQSYRTLKQSSDYYVSESQINALGYRLLD